MGINLLIAVLHIPNVPCAFSCVFQEDHVFYLGRHAIDWTFLYHVLPHNSWWIKWKTENTISPAQFHNLTNKNRRNRQNRYSTHVTIYFPGFVKDVGVKLVLYVETSLFVTWCGHALVLYVETFLFVTWCGHATVSECE